MQQVVERLHVLPALRIEVALIRGENAALSQLGCRQDERYIRQVHRASIRRIDTACRDRYSGKVGKNQQLQIRISAEDKARIQERAASAGMDVSNWVLNLVLPPVEREFQALCGELVTRPEARSYTFAELHDLFGRLNGKEFEQAVRQAPEVVLPPFETNYLAAMIEYVATLKGTVVPGWTRTVPPLERPWFASSLKSLRLYLLTVSPPPFRRRNLFVDSSVGRRV